jgi:hypothetical protein
MGKFIYGPTMTVEFDDRALAHLQIVIGAKLRRGESCYFSWRDDARAGGGQTALWLHPTMQIGFRYYGGHQPAINRAWVELLTLTANSPRGLRLVPEPQPTPDRSQAEARPRSGGMSSLEEKL